MSQIQVVTAQPKTIQANSTVSAATNASPIAITTSAVHGLQTGDIVQIAGAVGNLAANGQFVITVTSTTAFTLNNSNGSGAWTSGGTVLHVGFTNGGILIDNTVFTNGIPTQLTLCSRLEIGTQSLGVRFVWEDSADAAFVTAMPGPTYAMKGVQGISYDRKYSQKYQDFPDLRIAAAGDYIRLKVLFGQPIIGASIQYSAWLEY